ncbi:MAG: hypothetical protein ACHREM_12305 [Polyangiales bacterium]
MEPNLRRLFNAAYSPELYRRYIDRLETRLGTKIPFRVAESPLFLPKSLRNKLERYANEIVDQISQPAKIAEMKSAIPARYDVPGLEASGPTAACLQVDFAIVRGDDGELTGRVVELQGFPSLYALMVMQTEALAAELAAFPGLDRDWSLFYSGHTRASFVEKLKRTLVADCDPREVILLDLHPKDQKTYPDFAATKILTGVDAIGPEQLEREGSKLYRLVGGERVQVKRIFNRVVYDELEKSGVAMPFSWTEPLDVTWVPHPNWYWIWSKFTLPHIDHEAVPKATLLSELSEVPADLEHYVLKPLFSFAGAGVVVDVTREDIDNVPMDQREGWILQRKIHYEPGLVTPEGHGVKAEVRMMFLREPHEARPQLVLNLVRMSRGKMLGVDQNKGLDWVGGSVGIWAEDD